MAELTPIMKDFENDWDNYYHGNDPKEIINILLHRKSVDDYKEKYKNETKKMKERNKTDGNLGENKNKAEMGYRTRSKAKQEEQEKKEKAMKGNKRKRQTETSDEDVIFHDPSGFENNPRIYAYTDTRSEQKYDSDEGLEFKTKNRLPQNHDAKIEDFEGGFGDFNE